MSASSGPEIERLILLLGKLPGIKCSQEKCAAVFRPGTRH